MRHASLILFLKWGYIFYVGCDTFFSEILISIFLDMLVLPGVQYVIKLLILPILFNKYVQISLVVEDKHAIGSVHGLYYCNFPITKLKSLSTYFLLVWALGLIWDCQSSLISFDLVALCHCWTIWNVKYLSIALHCSSPFWSVSYRKGKRWGKELRKRSWRKWMGKVFLVYESLEGKKEGRKYLIFQIWLHKYIYEVIN